MLYLFLSVLAFFAGVLVHPVLHEKTRLLALLDALIVLAVLALLVFFMLPHTLEESGSVGVLGIAAGFGLTAGINKLSQLSTKKIQSWGLAILLFALLAHAAFDGAALALPDHHEGTASVSVAAGVLIHRFPLGMVIHHLLGPALKLPLIAATLVSASTVIGYFSANEAFTESNQQVIYMLECFVVGMLMEVVVSHLGSIKILVSSKD